MMTTRREKLEALLADDPNDTFVLYALAMESKSEGQLEDAIDGMQRLTRHDPPVVGAYLMGAQYLLEDDRIEEARAMLRDGIEEARRQNDLHAAGEMGELLQTLGAL